MTDHFDHDDMVANILTYWRSASPEQHEAGVRWYPLAGRLAQLIADEVGISPDRIGFAIAALSPRNPWRWNVADAYAFASAKAEGRTMPRATTFKRNWVRAWQALDTGIDPWTGTAPKVRAFVACIFGDHDAVVVDVWAVRVATGGSKSRVTDKQYAKVASAYRHAAEQLGELPSTVQAVTWLVAQTEGLATHRVGRHDLTFKAGTPDFIRAALQA